MDAMNTVVLGTEAQIAIMEAGKVALDHRLTVETDVIEAVAHWDGI